MYIAVLDEFPDFMTPTLVAHSVLAAHKKFEGSSVYNAWFEDDFRKVVVRVNQKEFDKISNLPKIHLGHENTTLEGRKSCAVVYPYSEEDVVPNVLKFATLWKPDDSKELKAYKDHFDGYDLVFNGEELVWIE